jgi:diguanylate cyclase (GGDEF)-like protein
MTKRTLEALTSLLRHTTIRYRLIGVFIVLSVMPLLISGYISFVESSQAIQGQAQIFATEIVKQVAKNVQLRMAQIDANVEMLILSDRVQTALARYADEDAADQAQAHAAMPSILLNAYGSFDYINQMYFLTSSNQIMDSQVFAKLGQSVQAFAGKGFRLNGKPYWGTIDLPNGQKGIAMTRQIFFKANNRVAGGLYLGLKPSHFSEIFEDVSLVEGSEIYVMDVLEGSVIVESKARLARMNDEAPHLELKQAVLHAVKLGQSTGSITYESKSPETAMGRGNVRVVAVYSQIPSTNWFVVNTIPYDSLIAEARSVRNTITLMGSLGLIAAILLSFVIGHSILDPLKQLMKLIQHAETGSVPVQSATEGNDELTVLSQKFSDLSVKIKREHELLEERVHERTLALEKANQTLAELSATDALTGIANRRQFDEVLANEWRRAARLSQPLALAMIDIDWFKKYNDHYGHQAGDECLRRVATLLQLCVLRPGDLVARYGGEEFVFVATATDGPNALRIARNFCETLQSLALPHAMSSFACVTASIGVAAMVADEDHAPEALLRAADHALYQAKALGRNQAVLFTKPEA